MSAYREAFEAAAERPDDFWLTAAQAIDWTVAPTRALDESAAPHYRWFPDGQLNTCYNALDRHVEAGNGDRTALIYDSAVTDTKRVYTYAELLDQTARFAGVLRSLGVGKGDRVILMLGNQTELWESMLAVSKLGAVIMPTTGALGAEDLADRITRGAAQYVIANAADAAEGWWQAQSPLLARHRVLAIDWLGDGDGLDGLV